METRVAKLEVSMANITASNENVLNMVAHARPACVNREDSHQSNARPVVEGVVVAQHAHRHEPANATNRRDIDELVAEIFDLPIPPTNDQVISEPEVFVLPSPPTRSPPAVEPEDPFSQYPTLYDASTGQVTAPVNEFFDTCVEKICRRDMKKLPRLKSDAAKQHYITTVNAALQSLNVHPMITDEGTKTWQCGFCRKRIDATKNIIPHVAAHIKRAEYDEADVHSDLVALKQFFND